METSQAPSVLNDARVANLLVRLRDEPDSREVLLSLAVAFNARSMPDDARDACERLLAKDPEDHDAWWENILAHSFGGAPELQPLVQRVEALAARHPDASWTHRNLGLLYYYLERDADTREACRRACHLDGGDAKAQEVLAYLDYTVGDLDGAIEHGIKAVELDATNFRALHWLGECYLKLDATEQAVRYFHRALRIEDCFFFALESLAALYLREPASFVKAWQCFARILAVNPRYFPAYFRLADAYLQADRLVEAEAQARAVLQVGPDRTAEADAHQYIGLARLMQALPDAREHFEAALALDPQFAAAHHYLGVLWEQEGDATAAEASYRQAIQGDAEYALPHVRLGYLCFDRKEYQNARRHFERALAIDPEDYLAHLGMGEIARWRKDYPEQLEHCLRAAELAPEDSNVRNQLGTAYDALGQPQDALAEYDAAIRLEPHDRQAANNLGWLLERLLKEATPATEPALRARAVDAWKRRLLICRDERASTRGARSHLERLGVAPETVTEWLERDQVAR